MANGYHTSVMVDEVFRCLQVEAGKNYLDATAGDGGHSIAIAKAGGNVVALDRDSQAIERFSKRLQSIDQKFSQKILIKHARFSECRKVAEDLNMIFDGILFDLGVSTYQFKESKRGFSFKDNQSFDMRMDIQAGVSAAELVNSLSEEDLVWVLQHYGEEPQAKKIAREIIHMRKHKRITNAAEVAEMVTSIFPKKKGDSIHQATRTFQAIRILVNDELEELKIGLQACLTILKSGGSIAVISFHSLEDRIVKNFFRTSSAIYELQKKPILPSFTELKRNPLARSAKLRVAIRN